MTRLDKMRPIKCMGVLLIVAASAAILSVRSHADMQTSKRNTPSAVESGNQDEGVRPVAAAIQKFIGLAEKGEIDRVRVRYRSWLSYTSKPVLERDLLYGSCDWELVLRDTAIQESPRQLAEGLKNYRLREHNPTSSFCDFVLGVVYHCRQEEVLRVCVSKDPFLLSINGQRLQTDPRIICTLTRFLPSAAREEVFVRAMLEWTTSSQSSSLPDERGTRGQAPFKRRDIETQ